MTFLSATLDWFSGQRCSHMGPFQYAAHDGMRDGQSTSGTLLWAKAEAERNAAAGNMVNAETNLLHKVAKEIGDYVAAGTTVVELGPGTATAFKNKTLPIIHQLQSPGCVLVDESMEFLKQIATSDIEHGLEIKPVMDDFFENEDAYFDDDALVCSFGSTISNIINPVSPELPQEALVGSLSKLAHAANKGWMLVGFDSDQNGNRITGYFKKHSLFQLNILDRMVAELPIEGDFDPKAFNYAADWIAASGQAAHTAIVERDMKFKIRQTEIALKQGQKLHIKNSYKFTPAFFEKCCALAGLEVVKAWTDDSPAKIYLLKILPRRLALRPAPLLKQVLDAKAVLPIAI